MPVPKIFKRFSSKNALKSTRDGDLAPDVPASHEKDTSSKTLVMVPVVPTFPDNLKEAWAAANKEVPQAQGVEKFLNRVGTSIIGYSACAIALTWPSRGCTE